MTDRYPRAPRLPKNSCILTAAMLESAQRVFLYHTTSPVHWMDLCTLIDCVVLYDSIAFPVIYSEYAEPLLGPLRQSGLADPWYPEAGLLNLDSPKEELWGHVRNDDVPQVNRLLAGGWPDRNYEALSEVGKEALDGVAHGFSEPALMKSDNEASILLWGSFLRMRSDPTFERAAALRLQKGVTDIEKISPDKRAAYSVPHATIEDIYNHYAENLRALANDTRAIIAKSIIEEPSFDSISVEAAARNTLHTLLTDAFEQKVTAEVGKYVRAVPISPFSAIALSQATNLNDVMAIAIDLRTTFGPYRALLSAYRDRLAAMQVGQTLELSLELKKIEASFQQSLQVSFKRIGYEGVSTSLLFDGMRGIERVAKATASGDYTSVLERMSARFIDLLKSWYFMNYGGVYSVVSHFPKVQQVGAASYRLTGKELDSGLMSIVADAAKKIAKHYRLPAVRI